jgi:hypothetical protein
MFLVKLHSKTHDGDGVFARLFDSREKMMICILDCFRFLTQANNATEAQINSGGVPQFRDQTSKGYFGELSDYFCWTGICEWSNDELMFRYEIVTMRGMPDLLDNWL